MQTENLSPLLIMAINMTIVFCVLIALGILMKIIYWIDPTRLKKVAAAREAAVAPAPVAASPISVRTGLNQEEVIAVIAAAVVALGYSEDQIASIRPSASPKWTLEGRLSARM